MLAVGYEAATVEQICAAAGVTKGSFFHYFSSKEELGKVLLERFAARQQGQFAAACGALEDPLERIYAMVDLAIAAAGNPQMKGCLLGTVAQEIHESHPELVQVCKLSFEGFARGMGQDFLAAKERCAPQANFDAASLATYFLSIVQGSLLLLRSNGDREQMALNLGHFRSYLRSLYGR